MSMHKIMPLAGLLLSLGCTDQETPPPTTRGSPPVWPNPAPAGQLRPLPSPAGRPKAASPRVSRRYNRYGGQFLAYDPATGVATLKTPRA